MKKSLKHCLKIAMQSGNMPIDTAHLQQTLLLAGQELRNTPRRRQIKFCSFLALQIRFIGWKIWLAQGLLLAAGCYVLNAAFGKDFYYNRRYAAILLCSIAILIIMTAIPFIQRAFRYRMNEIESATYFSSVSLLISKLLIIGIGDMVILNGLLFLAAFITPLTMCDVFLYLVFPFLLAGCGCLYLLGHTPPQWFSQCCIALCSILHVCLALLNRFLPTFFQKTFSAGWAAVCVILIFLCALQFRYIMRCSSYAEMQIEQNIIKI